MPLQAGPCPVVTHGGPRVGIGYGYLHVAERDPGVERGCDKGVAQRVRADLLGDSGAAGHPADDPDAAVPVQTLPVRGHEQRSRAMHDLQLTRRLDYNQSASSLPSMRRSAQPRPRGAAITDHPLWRGT